MTTIIPSGFVYIASSVGYPGLLKVGYTSQSVNAQLRELEGAGSPYTFEALAQFRVLNPMQVESGVHEMLSSHRFNKEWFNCSLDKAIKAVRATAGEQLLGSCSGNEYKVSKGNLGRWSAARKKQEVYVQDANHKVSSVAAEVSTKVKQDSAEKTQAILGDSRYPRFVQWLALFPFIILLGFMTFQGKYGMLSLVPVIPVIAMWIWLSRKNKALNYQSNAYKKHTRHIEKQTDIKVKNGQHDLLRDLTIQVEKLDKCQLGETQAEAIFQQVTSMEDEGRKPHLISVTCSSCQTSFESYLAPQQICSDCGETF